MTSRARTPTRLYKYRAFDTRLVDMLVEDKVFFAEPSTFNDPLDTRPEVEPDLDILELEEVFERLTTARISAEMTAAAKRIRYSGHKTLAHIGDHTRREAKLLLRNIAYQATDPESEEPAPIPQQRLLAMHIARELQRQYERGVLSLGAKYDSVLMWSHYGDQHRGVCIGYSMHRLSGVVPQPVRYGGNRLVPASRIRAMLDGDQDARALVDRDALLRKAADWRYEKEWRILSTKGLTDSPLELREVIFGTRCSDSVKHAIRRALEGRERPVRFYEMREVPGKFLLRRVRSDDGPENQPRRALSMPEHAEAFDVLPAK